MVLGFLKVAITVGGPPFGGGRIGRARGRATMELDDAKFVAGLHSAPQTAGLRRAQCAFARSFVFLLFLSCPAFFSAKSAMDLAIVPFFGDVGAKSTKN